MVVCRNLKINEENIEKLELARFDAYGMKTDEFDIKNTFYANELRNKKFLAFGTYLEDELIGGCYVSNSRNSLFIEQLFIKRKYQRLKLGTLLLTYILENKEMIEKYYQREFNACCLENRKELDKFYESLGYKRINQMVMKKRI